MLIKPKQLYSRSNRNTHLNKIIQFPLSRILIAIGFILPTVICFNLFYKNLEPRWITYIGDLGAVVIILLYCCSYALYAKIIERRSALEISSKDIIQETSIGFLISTVLVLLTRLNKYYKC